MKELKMAISGAFLVMFILLSYCEAQSSTTEEADFELRQKIGREWIKVAESIAKTTKDKQALETVDFVLAHSAPAVPKKEMISIDQDTLDDPRGFGILIVLDKDRKIDDFYKDFLDNPNIGASFNPAMRIMMIRGDVEISATWKGLLMLHECAHAYAFLSNPYDWRDNKTYCHEEKKVHEFQNRLTNILGGTAFTKFVNDKADEIEVPKSTNLEKEVIIFKSGDINTNIFFGKPLSDLENGFRISSISIEINFKLIEKKFKGDIEDKKAVSLFKRYAEAGILTPQE